VRAGMTTASKSLTAMPEYAENSSSVESGSPRSISLQSKVKGGGEATDVAADELIRTLCHESRGILS
jgi:hypothetical protein